MAENEGVEEIVIVDAADDDGGAAPAGQAPAAAAEPEDGVEQLRRQLEDERAGRQRDQAALAQEQRQRQAAEQRARSHQNESEQFRTAAQSAEYDSVINALSLAQGEETSLRSAYSAALSEGDFDKAAEINSKISRVTTRLVQLEEGKVALDAQRQARAEGRSTEAAKPAVTQEVQDAREAYLAQRTPRTAAWLRAHPAFFDDVKLQNKILGAHQFALAEGLEADSDEYFRYVEQQSGISPAAAAPPAASAVAAVTQRAGGEQQQAPAAAEVAAMPAAVSTAGEARPAGRVANAAPAPAARVAAAAPSRDVVTGSTARSTTSVALTKLEREHAPFLFPEAKTTAEAEQLYARSKLMDQREGRAPRGI